MPDLATLAAEYWDYRLANEINHSIQRGFMTYADRVEDVSRDAVAERTARYRRFIADAKAIDPGALGLDDRVTRLALISTARAVIAQLAGYDFMYSSHTVGLHGALFNSLPGLPVSTADHAAATVTRYRRLGGMIDQLGERLANAAVQGRVGTAHTVEQTIAQIDDYLAGPLEADRLAGVRAPSSFDEAAVAAYRSDIRSAIGEVIRPAFARYRDVLEEEVLPAGRSVEQPGLCWIDRGDEEYAGLVNGYTTLELTADEIHRIGLDVVAELEAEYHHLGGRLFGMDAVEGIFAKLTGDPDLRYRTAADIVADSETAVARATAAAPEAFRRVPSSGCAVVATDIGPLAFYKPPAKDGSAPGTFFVNASDPSAWGRYQMEATSFHEAVPGHHFQIGIAQELDGVPEFRANTYIGAYSEGWALYTERLADEMGLYSTDLDRMGMLSADSMRATRLVVDTGIHARGWSREQAIDYMADNAPMSRDLVANEIDRYIAMPGQALSYMIGRREIVRLRADAERDLGDRFDLAEFHDRILGSGMVPLGALGEIVADWVAAADAGAGAT